MPGPSALVVALIVPFVESLAGTTLPLEGGACAALSAPATLSRVPFWPRPQPPRPAMVAAVIAAVKSRIRIGISCAEGFLNDRVERRVCAAAADLERVRQGSAKALYGRIGICQFCHTVPREAPKRSRVLSR